MKVVVVGGGWAGVAAAISAKKQGAQVIIAERTDMLLGTGLVGGIMRNNGRFTVAEEMIAMGAGELFKICDENTRHKNLDFPGHRHASLYDIASTHGAVLQQLAQMGIEISFSTKISSVNMKDGLVHSILGQRHGKTVEYEADAFIDATGTAGGMDNCKKYGNGCAMCVLRCPSFGNRVSLASLCGAKEISSLRADGSSGAMSGACKLHKHSLSQQIQDELNEKGIAIITVPYSVLQNHLELKACQQYALPEFKDNIILLDTGHAKMMVPFYNVELLRQIPGMENVRYEDPYAGSNGNSVRFLSMCMHDGFFKVDGLKNVYCCGEKSGLYVGHTEAILTGTVAGFNCATNKNLKLPESLACGFAINFVSQKMTTEDGMKHKYTFSGSVLFEKIVEMSLYTTDISEIEKRVDQCSVKNIFM